MIELYRAILGIITIEIGTTVVAAQRIGVSCAAGRRLD